MLGNERFLFLGILHGQDDILHLFIQEEESGFLRFSVFSRAQSSGKRTECVRFSAHTNLNLLHADYYIFRSRRWNH